MDRFKDSTIADFLRRSYFAVDGLWFVKIEEESSFERALALDEQVWKIMPKIQARKARQLLGVEGGSLKDLIRCFGLKFAAEGYEYDVDWTSEHDAELVVTHCPWYAILQSSGRQTIAAAIADAICTNEFTGWTKEFSEAIGFSLDHKICAGADKCLLRFKER